MRTVKHIAIPFAVGIALLGVSWGCLADVQVHYVHLTGKVTENTMRRVMEASFQLCGPMHITPVRPPADEPMIKMERRVYYARQATIVYETATSFVRDQTRDCSFAGKEKSSDKAQLWTPKGHCDIDLKLKRAVGRNGSCHAEEFITATTELHPPYPNKQAVAGTRNIAGLPCTVYRGGYGALQSERCIRVPSGFSPYKDSVGFDSPAGLTLLAHVFKAGMEDPDDGAPYLSADEVRENTRVPMDVFIPHIKGGFKILDGANQ